MKSYQCQIAWISSVIICKIDPYMDRLITTNISLLKNIHSVSTMHLNIIVDEPMMSFLSCCQRKTGMIDCCSAAQNYEHTNQQLCILHCRRKPMQTAKTVLLQSMCILMVIFQVNLGSPTFFFFHLFWNRTFGDVS